MFDYVRKELERLYDKMMLGQYDSAENAVDGVIKLIECVKTLNREIEKLTERIEKLEFKEPAEQTESAKNDQRSHAIEK